ncbi:hypothetical protein OAD66_05275 [Bacteroidia bacterium]|nr:hypothetical protein [Bacteroidia bacterium]
MVSFLANLLSEDGILFIRMASNFATRVPFIINENGKSNLPDGSTRYLLNQSQLNKVMIVNELSFLEPLKTVNVNDERCMSTLVLTK